MVVDPKDRAWLFARYLVGQGLEYRQIAEAFSLKPSTCIEGVRIARLTLQTEWKTLLNNLKLDRFERAQITDNEVCDLRNTQPSLTRNEQTKQLGITKSVLHHSVNRLIRKKRIRSQNPTPEAATARDKRVGVITLTRPNLTSKQIAGYIGSTESKVMHSRRRLVRNDEIPRKNPPVGKTQEKLAKHLRTHRRKKPGEPINLTHAAKAIGIPASFAHILYERIKLKEPVPEKYQRGQYQPNKRQAQPKSPNTQKP
ncbi:MAG: hypothetical protein A2700_02120 [Candidatus Blackburnbacteria bacterium RIFCSPHIGHO2_01_FULL_44_64]|uniref:Uncharacterized protein n=1 Tax=Candidatus Blackburnbacteria bacterium RIFCSPHIGHO2_02_FULL_44_20 TaxID=1797516 RepID=A0A1G1V7X7_9BACT|nr:MAG: hypothetical protein A2700_02120 [Candidatus Blackburnbacteria bacterium RIFCSPHIGHO2_01_FULL_44_64]OGY11199.1 MAG: hypothetical protein A3E16_00350 [Candidatus Blackburnbacteria bacterium RIFCSPHIGHO2_12_FULL_44_25]OGY11486.1 MAG: hypothetical protein A3D26_04660 [Candidatus Blackburnbacteria bacterium RIFCSPHIGHO2_02_FULL_44_20]OGY15169.1 MAG: hypothetical protein A3A62_01415 [Candidatus Blackburnbacteria bacterium RIFCSPLOWO2_01_FULL_44_43]OGY17553.1 MAG: hypothetical protein A3H88_0